MNSPPKWAGVSPCEVAFDENLSRKLVQRLADCIPVPLMSSATELLRSPDREIWDFAKANGFLIISTDVDFYNLAMTLGPPPKIVWLRRRTHPTADAERVLHREYRS